MAETEKPISTVTIVGGGSAGWITAGLIAAKYADGAGRDVHVRVIEAPDIPIIGVGEGTWPTMRSTLRAIGVSESDFLRACDVSFKQGTKFQGWKTGDPEEHYYHPFTAPQGFFDNNLAAYWLRYGGSRSFSDMVCVQEKICEERLAPKNKTTPDYSGILNYGYHLNAGKFSEFLKSHCTANLGVELIIDKVVEVVADDHGDIDHLLMESGIAVDGGLFVDCTGFRSLLIDGHYNSRLIDKKGALFIDSAIATQVSYGGASNILSQTNSTASAAGWIWDISLQHRRGVGHVFSSAHMSDAEAELHLYNYIASTGGDPSEIETRKISINPGFRERFWVNNCVAIGLSAGFVEPLEASALVLVELSASMLANELPWNRTVMDMSARRFNERFSYRWERIIDFLKLHYVLSQRTEPFWRDNRDKESMTDGMLERLYYWRHHAPWLDEFNRTDEVFPAASYQYVLYGMGFEMVKGANAIAAADRDDADALLTDVERQRQHLLSILPGNKTLIDELTTIG